MQFDFKFLDGHWLATVFTLWCAIDLVPADTTEWTRSCSVASKNCKTESSDKLWSSIGLLTLVANPQIYAEVSPLRVSPESSHLQELPTHPSHFFPLCCDTIYLYTDRNGYTSNSLLYMVYRPQVSKRGTPCIGIVRLSIDYRLRYYNRLKLR